MKFMFYNYTGQNFFLKILMEMKNKKENKIIIVILILFYNTLKILLLLMIAYKRTLGRNLKNKNFQ